MINKKILNLIICVLVCLVLQVAVIPLLLPSWLSPNLITVLAVFIAINYVSQVGLFLVFSLGILLDLLSANVLGVWALSYVSIFVVFLLLAQNLFMETKMVILVTTTFATILAELIAVSTSGDIFKEHWFGFVSIFCSGLSSGLMALLIFPYLPRSLRDR